MRVAKSISKRMTWVIAALVLVISQITPVILTTGSAKAAAYELGSASGIWTDTDGGSNITGLNTNEVHWGSSANNQGKTSGLKFVGSTNQTFNEGDKFLLGTLTHLNWPIYNAADGATLKIVLDFNTPTVTPDPDFSYDFVIDETTNSYPCSAWQVSSTPCDDKITFPNSYGTKSFTIGDKLYTLKIEGFTNCGAGNTPVSQFITEENKDSSACLYGSLSSILVNTPQLTLVEKAVNGNDADVAPGPTLSVGDTASFTYKVQNTGNVTMTNIVVTDDKGVVVTCPKTTLAAGELMTCTGSAPVVNGAYKNTAYASGKYDGKTYKSNNEVANYTGAPKPGNLTVTKVVVNNDGGAAVVANFPLFVNGTPVVSGQSYSYAPGIYTVTETQKDGYSLTGVSGTCTKNSHTGVITVNVVANGNATCIITNNDKAPELTLKKKVTNNNGGTATASNWTVTATPAQNSVGAVVISGNGSNGVNDRDAKANVAYTLSESGPSGYTFVKWTCDGGTLVGNVLTLGLDEEVECEVENNDNAPSLTLVKKVTNDNGGGAVPTAWTLNAVGATNSPTNLSGKTGVKSGDDFKADTYTLSETGGPTGYTKSAWVCTGTGTQNGSTIKLAPGQNASCTITNDDDTPALTLIKKLGETYGSNVKITDWTLTATGALDPSTDLSGATGTAGATSGATFKADTYTLGETGPTGFTSSWNCVGGTLAQQAVAIALGQTVTCTVTNTAIQPKLTVTKIVDNTYGGDKKVSDFPLNVSGTSVTSGVPSGFNVGDYTVGEVGDPNYTAVFSGDCDAEGKVSLKLADDKECTITNTSNGGTIIINKVVINDDDGESTAGDFSVKVNGGESIWFDEDNEDELSGQIVLNVPVGTYKVIEDQEDDNGYFTVYENDCEDDEWDWDKIAAPRSLGLNNYDDEWEEEEDCFPGDCEELVVKLGETITCTITNDDDGEGTGRSVDLSVEKDDKGVVAQADGSFDYGIFVRNNSQNPATNVVMEDVIPATLKVNSISDGDWNCAVTGADSNGYGGTLTCTLPSLNGGEYADSIILNVTVASGAQGVIENTACVDSTQRDYNTENNCDTEETPIESIKVVKTGPATASAGDTVTYTFTVTNTGETPLTGVTVTDNIAGVGVYQSGDVNDNGVLEQTETWIFTANYKIPANATNQVNNTAIACGTTFFLDDNEEVEYNDSLQILRLNSIVIDNPTPVTPVCDDDLHTLTVNEELADTGNQVVLTSVMAFAMIVGALYLAVPQKRDLTSRK